MPDLHFELASVPRQVGIIMILYHTNHGRQAAEVFFFNRAGLVCRAAAHYTDLVN
ncbi:hypothetical protein TSACC_23176 [Terrimicrobium sacchariphilum]|uniref:Uncharacterized protein n=1 Tax=Terrimicrobium sacchariphilum TaxID=690879 RepID=A0A146GC14_TERSA|nr:hypothetical protein TSACC_23176 [Terrimicrobium sacchariphilum]